MNRAEENNDLYGKSPKGENIMFKKKIIAAGMTAFAITTMAGITALASQKFGNQNMIDCKSGKMLCLLGDLACLYLLLINF